MSFKTRSFSLVVVLVLSFQLVGAQDLKNTAELDSFLEKAESQSQKYLEAFRNLSAEETKTKLYYKKSGKLKEKRVIKSLFIVYPSFHNNTIQEFRNVFEYNGRKVDAGNKTTDKLFKELAKSSSAAKEYIKIRKYGTRFDGRVSSWGITLYQPRPFSRALKGSFEFEFVGREKINERVVFVIRYKQIKPTLLITSSPSIKDRLKFRGGTEYTSPTSTHFRPTNPLMNGRLWLDAETAQIWKNEFEIVLHPKALSKPVTNVEMIYEYQQSEFGVLLPKMFLIRSYKIRGKNDVSLRINKDSETIYEYSKFSEFKTDAKVGDESGN